MRAQRLSALIAVVLAFAAPQASALDGEILIDKAKVLAGGISQGDKPDFPITLSKAGHYKLTENLTVPLNKNGFVVTGDYVTIDLNGFTLNGGKKANRGVNAADVKGLTVMNGTIVRFTSHGVLNRPGAFAILEDLQLRENGGAGAWLNRDSRVSGSSIVANAGAGIVCFVRCLIADNVINSSKTESGIALLTSAGGHLILGNVLSDNQLFGIYAEGPSGFGNNTLTGNNSGGSQISGAFIAPLDPNVCSPADPPECP